MAAGVWRSAEMLRVTVGSSNMNTSKARITVCGRRISSVGNRSGSSGAISIPITGQSKDDQVSLIAEEPIQARKLQM